MDAITKEALGTVDQISPRNQSKYQKALNSRAAIWQYQTVSEANVMKFEQAVKKTDAAIDLAVQGFADPATRQASVTLANNQINDAVADGRYSREAADLKLKFVSDVRLGYDMADEYRKAVEAGTDADYMASMADETFSPDTLNTFFNEKKLYDSEVGAKIAEEKAIEQLKLDRAFSNVQQDIIWRPIETDDDLKSFMTSYSNDAINNYADANKLSLGNRGKLFTARNKRLKELASRGNKERGGTIEPDLSSKEFRNDIDSRATSELQIDTTGDVSPEQRDAIVAWEVQNAPKLGAVGTTATNFLNNSALGGSYGTTDRGWEQFMKALPIYEELARMDGVTTDGIDSKTKQMFEITRYMNWQDDPDRARQIWINYRSASAEELSYAEQQYNTEDLFDALNSDEDLATRAGLIRADSWMWFNAEPDMPGATRAQMERVAKSMATSMALTNGTVNYTELADMVANVMGTMVSTSTLNKNVPSGSDSLGRISEESMLYPPVPKEAESWARRVLEQDFLPGGQATTKVKVFNKEYTIVAPYDFSMESEARMAMSDQAIGISETLPDPYADIPGDVIPVNMLQVVTPPLRQNQFRQDGTRIWHLFYRGKPILNVDNTFYEWTPYSDTEGRLREMEEENAIIQ